MRLHFLHLEQMKRLLTAAEEAQARQGYFSMDPTLGRLSIPNSVNNYPSYWKNKRSYVQYIVTRRRPSKLYITMRINPWR